ncbi:hypothetical protein IFM89_006558 [Coptis chinensis]|uniref:DUF2828 domain-containing protein n=1 Tax=Coptis chinensis TaxID=261450 RepID=A0A835IKC1_9MAGN|nr:hypothetical protein IFM89_006558 [Coptis chinensis]
MESTLLHDFMDLMVENFNKTKHAVNPRKGYTENNSPTFKSTGNPCLDFFFHVVPESLTKLLELAWKHNDLTSLKLVCHLRGVRGTGKSDKEGFYTAALWLHKHHPKTLACNVKWIEEFGYFKDLPELLYRLLEGSDVREFRKEEFLKKKKPRALKRGVRRGRGNTDRLQSEAKKKV